MKNKIRSMALITALVILSGTISAQRVPQQPQVKGVSIKSLFEDKNASVIIPKEIGIDKVVKRINKLSRSKASLETYERKQYIKVVTIEKKRKVTELYSVDNSNPAFLMIGGAGACQAGTCTDCNTVVNQGQVSCSCSAGSDTGDGCTKRTFLPFVNHISAQNPAIKDVAVTFDADGVTFTPRTIVDIKNAIAVEMPRMKVSKIEAIKEDGERYLRLEIGDGANKGVLLRKIATTPANTFYFSNGIWATKFLWCGGTCNGNDCRNVSPSYAVGGFYCPCVTHTCSIQHGFLAPGWQEQ